MFLEDMINCTSACMLLDRWRFLPSAAFVFIFTCVQIARSVEHLESITNIIYKFNQAIVVGISKKSLAGLLQKCESSKYRLAAPICKFGSHRYCREHWPRPWYGAAKKKSTLNSTEAFLKWFFEPTQIQILNYTTFFGSQICESEVGQWPAL